MLTKNYKFLFFFLFSFLLSFATYSTHLRAGEITAVRTGIFTYCFTITVYMDVGTDVMADSRTLDVNFGDGSPLVTVERAESSKIGNNTSINIYRICHTYPGNGNYVIYFIEENRNAGVLNFSNSVNTPFAVRTFISIDPVIGLNNTPVMRQPPIDIACVGQKWTHNPGAFDVDGDSLSYRFTVPLTGRNNQLFNVENYVNPNQVEPPGRNEANNGPAGFSIDPRTGTITWDAPAKEGEYNIAIIVEEWRNGNRIGFVVRDMQILVFRCMNRRPNLDPRTICVVADENPATDSNIIDQAVIATDPDNNPIEITSEKNQAVYDTRSGSRVFNTVATFTFTPNPQSSPASGRFRWDTKCEHVRREPYFVVFKAEDRPPPPNNPLTELETWQIKIYGPAPEGFTANPSGRAVQLSWSAYVCNQQTNPNVDSIIIWRRDGCVGALGCGMEPQMNGYVQIGRVPATATAFTDNGPLQVGLSYSYRITAKFKEPRGGTSLASIEQCISVPLNTPLLTKVSVINTSQTNGSIEINWIFPPDMNNVILPRPDPPYRYELYRSDGLTGTSNRVLIHTVTDNDPAKILSFTDNGLNTEQRSYSYQVELRTGPVALLLEPSPSGSNVRLTATPTENSVTLTWDYRVPWSNSNKVHRIFRGARNQPKSSYVEIGSVNVGTPRFVDEGTFQGICLRRDSVYSYFVITEGSYFNARVPVDPLFNDSQITSASPIDRTPPAPPLLSIDSLRCVLPAIEECFKPIDSPTQNFNVPFWKPRTSPNPCLNDIAFYRLYFKPTSEGDFKLLSTLTDTFYVHRSPNEVRSDLVSLAGCYYVTAVDKAGNESDSSNVVCKDNCIYYRLPNVFTPNNDGQNDIFKPCPEPRFVESVKFEVFNRWGNKVFESREVDLRWDGKNQQGQELSSGVYYYSVEIRFVTLNPSESVQKQSGWVSLLK